MRQFISAVALVLAPIVATADTASIVTDHIMPRVTQLSDESTDLADAAVADCTPDSIDLRAAYADAFDAWIGFSHLRFGPSEVNDRAFALAFWPDPRGATPRTLTGLITSQDPIGNQGADAYVDVSIAARGFYALEFLLFDAALSTAGNAAYHCALVQTVTADIARTAQAIADDWQTDYAARLSDTGPDKTYRSDAEAIQELFKALSTGLQFTADTRFDRPLGSFDRPRPARAEVWRSHRSARHVALALESLRDLAAQLAVSDQPLAADLDAAFVRAKAQLADLNDPVFASVAEPQGRFKVEAAQTSVQAIGALVRDRLGPILGVAVGFNALDGD